jgi:hypothetical protein
VTQVSAGAHHSLAVTASGQLYAFGSNAFGELGVATTPDPNPTPTLVPLPAGTTIDTVATGADAYHTLALVADLAIESSALPVGEVGTVYRSTLAASGGTEPLRWSADGLPAGLAIDPASGVISGEPMAAGEYATTVTVSDAYGARTARTLGVQVAQAPLGTTSVSLTPTARSAPRLDALRQSSSRWHAGTALSHLTSGAVSSKKGAPPVRGTTFSFSLDQASRVTFAFHHTSGGRRAGKRCVATTPRAAGKPHCTHELADGTIHVQARAGANRLHFEGLISRRSVLEPGTYSMTIMATSPVGTTSAPQVLHFTIATR